LALPPQFFAHKPLDLVFREGIRAEMCNRFQLGRPLVEVYAYGGDLLCSELALPVCVQAGIERRFHHLDPTSFSLSGAYVPEHDEQAIPITHGSSKDHRPDLTQAVLALLVSQDGGGPWVSKSWAGNASETQRFQERAEALRATLKRAPTPRYLVADSTVYNEDKAPNLSQFGFMPRMPGTRKLVTHGIMQALAWDTWQRLDATTRYACIALGHYGMAQRWLVVASQAALDRAETSVHKAWQRAWPALDKPLFPLPATRFATPEAAPAARTALAPAWKDAQGETSRLREHQHDAGTGRPRPTTPLQSMPWQMHAQGRPDQERSASHKQQGACCVIGTHMPPSP